MSVVETIEAAVLDSIHEAVSVTTERREIMNVRYVTEWDDEYEEEYEDEVYEGTGEYEDQEVRKYGEQFEGSNDEFAKLITERLLEEGDIRGKDARKVLSAVVEALNEYPTMEINGKVEHVYRGPSAESFAEELAPKVEAQLESKGMLSKIAGFLKLNR